MSLDITVDHRLDVASFLREGVGCFAGSCSTVGTAQITKRLRHSDQVGTSSLIKYHEMLEDSSPDGRKSSNQKGGPNRPKVSSGKEQATYRTGNETPLRGGINHIPPADTDPATLTTTSNNSTINTTGLGRVQDSPEMSAPDRVNGDVTRKEIKTSGEVFSHSLTEH